MCNGTPIGHNGSEGCANFVNFGEAIKLWGDSTGWVYFPVARITESSCLFHVLENACEFVFESSGRVLIDDPLCIGVCE